MISKESELIVPFIKEPWKKFTFKDIKKICKKTSDSYVYNSLKKFVKEKILKEEKAGNVILYSINLKETKTQTTIGFIAEQEGWKTKQLPFDVINNIEKKIPTPFHIFIITGSYARNKQKDTSDLDMVILVDDLQETKKIKAEIFSECQLSIPQGHPYIFKKSEYIAMLINSDANYGKEIVKNCIILKGGSEYFSILNEALQNGFKDL